MTQPRRILITGSRDFVEPLFITLSMPLYGCSSVASRWKQEESSSSTTAGPKASTPSPIRWPRQTSPTSWTPWRFGRTGRNTDGVRRSVAMPIE